MSSGTISSQAIRSSFHTLRQYIRDLQDAAPIDSATIAQRFSVFSTKLRLLVNYAERDDVCRWLARALHARGGAVVPWFRAVCAGDASEIGDAASTQVAHRYVVLEAIKRNAIDMRAFVSTVCARPGGFVAAFVAFRRLYIDELRERMEQLLRRIDGHLGDEDVDFDAVVETALTELDGPPARKRAAKRSPRRKTTKKAAKKTTKKATRKKAAKKTAKKATRKKAAKKTAKKATRKKAAKKTAKKATRKKAAKKTTKKATRKKVAKKTAKRATRKKAAKKTTKKRR